MDMPNTLLSSLPAWAAAAFILLAGVLGAVLARIVIHRLLQLLRFNHLCDRTGVSEFLRKGGVRFSPAELAGRGLSGLILIGVFLETAQHLDIAAVHELRLRAEAAFPGILSALLVLIVGLMVVGFLAGFLRTVIRNAGSPYATLWARIARGIGILLVLALALEQADISGSILPAVIQIIIAAFAFGMALAFGLGCKDLARQSLERLIAEMKEKHRDLTRSDLEG